MWPKLVNKYDNYLFELSYIYFYDRTEKMMRKISRPMLWFRGSSYSPTDSDDKNSKDDISPRIYGLFRHHTVPENKIEVFYRVFNTVFI